MLPPVGHLSEMTLDLPAGVKSELFVLWNRTEAAVLDEGLKRVDKYLFFYISLLLREMWAGWWRRIKQSLSVDPPSYTHAL